VLGVLGAAAKGLVPVLPALAGTLRILAHPLVWVLIAVLLLLVRLAPRRKPPPLSPEQRPRGERP
jgi:hypothetical protein